MPRWMWFLLALLGITVGGVLWWQSIRPRLSEEEVVGLVDWLTCDECTDGELAYVRDTLGSRALTFLGDALLSDSLALVERAREGIARSWSESPVPGVDSAQYVAYFGANFDAQIRKRAAVALGALGDTAALLRAASLTGLRPDVVAAVNEVRRTANRFEADRVLLRPASLTLAVGDTESLEALGRGPSGERVIATVTWTSSDPAVANVSSPDPGHGRVAAVAVGTATVTATMGPASADAAVTVAAPPVPPTTALTVVSGDAQVDTAGTRLNAPLVVRVTVAGVALAGIGVTWTVQGGGGLPLDTTISTNAAGLASFRPMLGPVPGIVSARARVGSRVAYFRARTTPP